MNRPPMDRTGRLDRLRSRMTADGVSQLLLSDLLNIRWLSGFTGSNALMLVSADRTVLITDSRYEIQLAEQTPSWIAPVISGSADGDRADDHIVGSLEGSTLTIEADSMSVAALESLESAIRDAGRPVDLARSEGLVADLRRIKDAGEIDRLRRAARIADAALEATLTWLRPGKTERRVARQLEWEMAERGSERPSFETILASGPNGGMPHARPSDRQLVEGDLVVIDFGATVDGYGSDMTRTIVIGNQPTDVQRRWYDNVAAAQAVGVAAIQAGTALRSIHRDTHGHLVASGQNGVYQHGTGHGVGLFIHERPILSSRIEGDVELGMALTVEPGAYLAGVGGVRVEDLVVVTPDGCEALSRFPKGLVPSL